MGATVVGSVVTPPAAEKGSEEDDEEEGEEEPAAAAATGVLLGGELAAGELHEDGGRPVDAGVVGALLEGGNDLVADDARGDGVGHYAF